MMGIEISTERLRLGKILDESRDDMFAIFSSEEVAKTYMLPEFQSKEEKIRLFERMKRISETEGRYVYGIYLEEKLIGFLNDVEICEDQIEMGYVVHPDYKNNGYATEAFAAMIKILFLSGFSVVKAGAFEENTASMRVMEKCGMTRTEQEEFLEYRGRTYRCINYSIYRR